MASFATLFANAGLDAKFNSFQLSVKASWKNGDSGTSSRKWNHGKNGTQSAVSEACTENTVLFDEYEIDSPSTWSAASLSGRQIVVSGLVLFDDKQLHVKFLLSSFLKRSVCVPRLPGARFTELVIKTSQAKRKIQYVISVPIALKAQL